MAERMLVTKVKRTDGTRAELYGKGHKFADLRLFDLGELAAVGLDPATLPIGVETPAHFWAVWEYSEKVNAAGNRYKDVVSLEPFEGPPAITVTTSAEGPGILEELRALRREVAELRAMVAGLRPAAPQPEPEPEPDAAILAAIFPRYQDGSQLGENPAEVAAYESYVKENGHSPANVAGLRAWAQAQRGNGHGRN